MGLLQKNPFLLLYRYNRGDEEEEEEEEERLYSIRGVKMRVTG